MEDIRKSIEKLKNSMDEKFDQINQTLSTTKGNFKIIHEKFQDINIQFQEVDSKIGFTNNVMVEIKDSFDDFASEVSDHIVDLDVRVSKIEKKLDL